MTKFPDLWNALAAEFHRDEVKSLPNKPKMRYVTARTVMNRLDHVLGPENWWDRYHNTPNGLRCKLTLILPDGSRISKVDGSGYAQMVERRDGKLVVDMENTEKTAYSLALRRVAAKFGVGRYLYDDGVFLFEPEAPTIRPENESGHGTGAYAAPTDVRNFERWLAKAAEHGQAKILDWATNPDGSVVPGVKDLSTYQLARHLLKAAPKKVLEAPPEGNLKSGQVNKLVALWYAQDPGAVKRETSSYVDKLAEAARQVRDGEADPEMPDDLEPAGAIRQPGEDG